MDGKQAFIRNSIAAACTKAADAPPGMNVRNYKGKYIQKITKGNPGYFCTDQITNQSAKQSAVKNKAAFHQTGFYRMTEHEPDNFKKAGEWKSGQKIKQLGK